MIASRVDSNVIGVGVRIIDRLRIRVTVRFGVPIKVYSLGDGSGLTLEQMFGLPIRYSFDNIEIKAAQFSLTNILEKIKVRVRVSVEVRISGYVRVRVRIQINIGF